jgi:hypothetical protein
MERVMSTSKLFQQIVHANTEANLWNAAAIESRAAAPSNVEVIRQLEAEAAAAKGKRS